MDHPDKLITKSSPADRTENIIIKETTSLEKKCRAGGKWERDSG